MTRWEHFFNLFFQSRKEEGRSHQHAERFVLFFAAWSHEMSPAREVKIMLARPLVRTVKTVRRTIFRQVKYGVFQEQPLLLYKEQSLALLAVSYPTTLTRRLATQSPRRSLAPVVTRAERRTKRRGKNKYCSGLCVLDFFSWTQKNFFFFQRDLLPLTRPLFYSCAAPASLHRLQKERTLWRREWKSWTTERR